MTGAAAAGGLATLPRRARAAESVKVGVLTDMSAASRDMSGPGSVIAAQLAIQDFGGHVLGKPIEVISADHLMKPDTGSMIASKWYDTEGVDLIADVPFSAVGLAVENVARDKKKILIVSGTGADPFTGKFCNPYSFQWTFDSTGLSSGTARALLKRGAKTFYFITPDYAFGHSMEDVATKMINANGGKVVGHSVYPYATPDLSSFLLAAQASGADVIASCAGPPDNINFVKQAGQFGIGGGKQQLAAMLAFINDIHAIGLPLAKGLIVTAGWYWDMDDKSRAFARRFQKLNGKMPSAVQAGVYSGVLHYLRAVKAVGSKDPDKVQARMRAMKVDDFFGRGCPVRGDGLCEHDLLLVRVKAPAASKSEWDIYEVLDKMPGKEAFPNVKTEGCALTAG